ncbi:hypothetical protein BD413DRAFT_534119 [Trametes elegans]|nr:hypothetical protein BD413DRAFT_534119 [Trametes elegans]
MASEEAVALARKRKRYREELAVALTQTADPLALYEDFISWTRNAYSGQIAHSGLLELLDEATRHFLDDPAYKNDLRYLKLWLLYAKHVEDPTIVYAFIFSKSIGKVYAQTYIDYAEALYKNGRQDEAEKVLAQGIRRHARPIDPLKARYEELKARTMIPARNPASQAALWEGAPSETLALRRAPLKNHPPSAASTAGPSSRARSNRVASTAPSSSQQGSQSSAPHNPYGAIQGPPQPGRRPEKLRFNLSLLLPAEGQEYCMQEARARSMGLLGKQWGPPPEAKRTSRVSFAGADGGRGGSTKTMSRRFGVGAEPTVTLATKEALADVFGMYNSPEKSTRLGTVAGSKHAPVKKVEPITPMAWYPSHARAAGTQNDRADLSAKTPTLKPFVDDPERRENQTPAPKFQPFVDENARRENETPAPSKLQPFVDDGARRENQTPAFAPTPRFQPFVDENARRENQTPAPAPASKLQPFVDSEDANKPAPNPTRPALSLKDSAGPPPPSVKQDENARSLKKLSIHTDTEKSKPSPVFTLTPASATFRDRPQGRWDIFTDEAAKSGGSEGVLRPSSARPDSSSGPKFMPFSDENAPRVFSRPVPRSENAPTPGPTFTPFTEPKQPLGSSTIGRAVLSERTPLAPAFTPRRDSESEDEPGPQHEEQEQVEEEQADPEPETPTTEDSDASAGAQEPFELEQQHSHDQFTSESSEDADYDSQNGSYVHPAEEVGPLPHEHQGGDESTYDDGDYEDVEGNDVGEGEGEGEDVHTDEYRAPLGGRFGQFDVMTPITERTFEYTMSTRGMGTPGGLTGQHDAVEAAVQLAAELQADEDEDEEEEEPVAQIEEQTGTLSLADALDVASSFRPPNPCNPTDPAIISTILRLISPDHGFHDLRGTESQQLDALQKFAKKKSRRASGNSTSGRSMQDSDTLEVHIDDRRFAVVDKLGEGGFGAVFEAIDLALARKDDDDDDDFDDDDDDDSEEQNRVALKVVKPRSLWEFHVLRRIHNTLPANLRRSIITPQALYAFKDESFLILELSKQGTLLDIVNRAPSAGLTQQGACLDELLVMFFSIELLRVLEGLHRAGFIHGDVKIDNCLVRLEDVPGPASAWESVYQPSGAGGWAHKGVKLIDFGRTIDTGLFPAGQRFVAEWPTDARDCFEARERRPWTFQTDYFGLAGIIFCLLYGKYVEAASVVPASEPPAGGRIRYKLATPFKRYWQGELWARLFDLLLNPTLVRPDGKLPVSDELAALRREMEAWLQANCNRASNSLKGLLKKVGLAILGGKDAR